jgi:hypothetical protein
MASAAEHVTVHLIPASPHRVAKSTAVAHARRGSAKPRHGTPDVRALTCAWGEGLCPDPDASTQGWVARPDSDGTRFTNDGTGYGMFVASRTSMRSDWERRLRNTDRKPSGVVRSTGNARGEGE